MMKRLLLAFALLSLLAACREGVAPDSLATVTGTSSPTLPAAPPPAAIIAPTMPIVLSPTADTRLPPERWREWPVVPGTTGRAIEIYRTGQEMGNDPRAFSKVGDCQSIKEAFMGYFDLPDRYELTPEYAYLQETIDQFSGYFNTDGQAVKGGFNAAAVLSPMWANPDVCLPGESPLECELRITRPVIVIVSLEVWWDGRTAEGYSAYMRQILDIIIAHGAVPILATKADNVEGDHSLNLATASLAYEYDIPLWNFWLAVQSLPNHGLDPERPDGFHISTDAWSVRSFTGLQALDNIWRGVRGSASTAGNTGQATPTPSTMIYPTASRSYVPTATLTPGPTPLGSSNRIVFDLMRRVGEGYEYQGVYLFDMLTGQTSQILGSGFNFQAASPDGRYILVNQGRVLYRAHADGTDLIPVTDSFYGWGATGAVWLPGNRLAALVTQDSGTAIQLLTAEGAFVLTFDPGDMDPIALYAPSDGRRLYWESGSCSSEGVCDQEGAWLTLLDVGITQSLVGILRPSLSPDGTLLAYASPLEEDKSNLVFVTLDGARPQSYPLPGENLAGIAWSPDSQRIAVMMTQRSDYSGRVSGVRNFIFEPRTFALTEFSAMTGLNPHVLWSPDGEYLLWLGTESSMDGYTLQVNRINLATSSVTDLSEVVGLASADYILVTSAAWLALP